MVRDVSAIADNRATMPRSPSRPPLPRSSLPVSGLLLSAALLFPRAAAAQGQPSPDALSAGAPPATATPPAGVQDATSVVDDRVRALERRLEALERERELERERREARDKRARDAAARERAAAQDPAGTKVEVSGGPGRGLSVKVGDAFSLNVRSRIQLRYQLNISPEDDAGERDLQQIVNIGTARLWFSGHVLTPGLTYMIQLAVAGRDFRDAATSPIFDAFVDWAAHRDLHIRAGQFFVPFDRLRTVREFALQMADRPRPVQELTLDRDVGVVLYSERFLSDRSPLAWRAGVFGGGGTNLTAGREPGALFLGRIELRPFGPIDDDSEGDLERRKAPGLALGAGVAANLNTNRVRSTTGATYTGGVTSYYHAAGDLVFKWRGVALQGEYLWKRAAAAEIASTTPDGAPKVEPTRSAHGWVAQASYTFDPPFEVVARLSRLYPLAGTAPAFVTELSRRGQEAGVGLNYYFNGHRFKLQADWIALMTPALQDADHAAHLQLDATF